MDKIDWEQFGGIELATVDEFLLVACGDGTWGVHRSPEPPLATGKTTGWDSARSAATAALRSLKESEVKE